MAEQDLTRGPEDNGVDSARRNAFEAYLELLLMDRAWVKMPKAYAGGQAGRWRVEEWVESWTKRRCMHAPLERLYDHLMTHIEDRL